MKLSQLCLYNASDLMQLCSKNYWKLELNNKITHKITSTAPPNIADNIPRAIVSVSVIIAVPSPSSSACIMAQVRFSVDSMKMSICEAFLRMDSPSLSHMSAIRWRMRRLCCVSEKNTIA